MKKTVLALMTELNSFTRLSLCGALEQEGYTTLCATTVQEAVERCQERCIDVLVLDLNRPLSLGWPIFDRLRSFAPAVPVVILTDRASDFEKAVAERVGALLEKPLSVPALVHTINVLVGQPARTHLPSTGKGKPLASHAA